MSSTHLNARPDDKNRTFQVVGFCRVRPDNFREDNPSGCSAMSGCRMSAIYKSVGEYAPHIIKRRRVTHLRDNRWNFLSGMTRQRLLYRFTLTHTL
jgi:hypothetical protein